MKNRKENLRDFESVVIPMADGRVGRKGVEGKVRLDPLSLHFFGEKLRGIETERTNSLWINQKYFCPNGAETDSN